MSALLALPQGPLQWTLCGAALLFFCLLVAWMAPEIRKIRRRSRILDARVARYTEDLAYRFGREDAYEAALRLAAGRGDVAAAMTLATIAGRKFTDAFLGR